MFNFGWKTQVKDEAEELLESSLFNEETFYEGFIKDLQKCQKEVIIESPYITTQRLSRFKPIFEKLIKKNVELFVITKYPNEHDEVMAVQAEAGIRYFEELGVQVLLCAGGHHRKLAMVDREILWEGSLNILSQAHSREFMRRIKSKSLTLETFEFLKLNKVLKKEV